MLVLTRRVGEQLVINDEIRITVLAAGRQRVRIGITAPASVRVDRAEIHLRRAQWTEPGGPASETVSR
jgi:carbon storage regulator